MKVGLFGGTFDPPHLGHLIMAVEVYTYLNLDMLLFMPTYQNSLKVNAPGANPFEREHMLNLMLNDFKGTLWGMHIGVDPYEVNARQIVPSIESLERWAQVEKVPKEELFFIMGSDNLSSLVRWVRSSEYKDFCQTVLVQRQHTILNIDPNELARIQATHNLIFVNPSQKTTISSTEIRKRIGEGKPVFHMLSPSVYNYIIEEGLYR